MAGEKNRWDRLDGESALWFARFDAFRLLGPSRTIEACYRAEKGRDRTCPGSWKTVAVRWQWRERAEAWDESQRPARQQQCLDALHEMSRKHVAHALLAIRKAVERMDQLDPKTLTPDQAVKLLAFGTELERTARTAPVEAENARRLAELEQAVRDAGGGAHVE